jgi:hypothetical protein
MFVNFTEWPIPLKFILSTIIMLLVVLPIALVTRWNFVFVGIAYLAVMVALVCLGLLLYEFVLVFGFFYFVVFVWNLVRDIKRLRGKRR